MFLAHANSTSMALWVIVGASRGIGLEFVRQLLARGDTVIATVRNASKASQLWLLAGAARLGACHLLECDVKSDASINVSRALISSHVPEG